MLKNRNNNDEQRRSNNDEQRRSNSNRPILQRTQHQFQVTVNALSGIVTNNMDMNPHSRDVYIFVNRSSNRIRLLHWEPGGMVLYCKMLERGTFALPDISDGVLSCFLPNKLLKNPILFNRKDIAYFIKMVKMPCNKA